MLSLKYFRSQLNQCEQKFWRVSFYGFFLTNSGNQMTKRDADKQVEIVKHTEKKERERKRERDREREK